MKFQNNKQSYGLLAKISHWLTFFILIVQLPLGIYLNNLEFSDFKLTFENIHILIGMTIFYITIFRLIWKSINVYPEHSSSISAIQIIAARISHWLFYVTLLTITLTGMLKLLMAGEEVNFIFISYESSYIDYDLAEIFHTLHSIGAYFLILLFVVHILAVIYHHYFLKDAILKKML